MCYSFSKRIKTIENHGKNISRKVLSAFFPSFRFSFTFFPALAPIISRKTKKHEEKKTSSQEHYYFVIFNRNFPSVCAFGFLSSSSSSLLRS